MIAKRPKILDKMWSPTIKRIYRGQFWFIRLGISKAQKMIFIKAYLTLLPTNWRESKVSWWFSMAFPIRGSQTPWHKCKVTYENLCRMWIWTAVLPQCVPKFLYQQWIYRNSFYWIIVYTLRIKWYSLNTQYLHHLGCSVFFRQSPWRQRFRLVIILAWQWQE